MSEAECKGCVILLNGFPGAGKLSIARTLQAMLQARNVESRLLDNHLMLDLIEAVHPGRGVEHMALRKPLRYVMFEAIKQLQRRDIVIILTGCLSTKGEDVAVFAEQVELAKTRDVPFFCFTLSVDEQEHLTRLRSAERVNGEKKKLTEPAILKELLTGYMLIDPTDEDTVAAVACGVQMHHRSVNTTNLSIEESANRILASITLPST